MPSIGAAIQGRAQVRALRRHAARADPACRGPRRGRIRRPGHRLQQRRGQRPARRHGDDDRRLGRHAGAAAALGGGRHDVRIAAPQGARRRIDRQHRVDLGPGLGLCAGGLFDEAKAAVLHFSKVTAADLARHRIRVNAVLPGFIATSIFGSGLRPGPRRVHADGRHAWPSAAAACSRRAAPAGRKTSPRRCSTWPATPPVSSPARTWWWMAA